MTEYEGHYYGCSIGDQPKYVKGSPVKVNADSLERALELIEQEARFEFPKDKFPLIHIDQVFVGEKPVYVTSWDEEGVPLASFEIV